MTPTALLIVEPNFLNIHVGVRRVIFNFWRELLRQGFRVSLATPADGRLLAARPTSLNWCLAQTDKSHQDAPYWRSEYGPLQESSLSQHGRTGASVRWSEKAITASEFDVSIITNPWLCADGGFKDPVSIGIVYDMVPNLIACGAINFGAFVDAYAFASAHDAGYQQYLDRAERIVCISDSSRQDFVDFYQLSASDARRVEAIIPYAFDPGARIRGFLNTSSERRILLVNVLDPRKNFDAANAVLKRLAKANIQLAIDVVGRERMAPQDAVRFLNEMSAHGFQVRWFRDASNACLSRLYADADVLLFPSFYEGLGLPILEAQNHGVPVVGSNTGSCFDINMNPALAASPADHSAIADRLLTVVDARSPSVSNVITGVELGDALKQYLAPRTAITF